MLLFHKMLHKWSAEESEWKTEVEFSSFFIFVCWQTLNTLSSLDCCLWAWYIHPVELWHHYLKDWESADDEKPLKSKYKLKVQTVRTVVTV